MSDTSTGLLRSVRDRTDTRSWDRFVHLYTPLLHKWLQRYAVPPHDADDLVQEVLLAAAREMPDFQYDRTKGSFRGWLRTTLVHRLQHYWRSGAAGVALGSDTLDRLADPHDDLSRVWDREHDHHVVGQLLDLIRSDFDLPTWDAFRRVVLEEERVSSVAGSLGLTPEAVYAAKYRVLNRLRQEARGLLG